MNLRKNFGLKLGAAIASVVTLLAGWALVHSNPPAGATGDSGTPASAAQTPTTSNGRAPARSGTLEQLHPHAASDAYEDSCLLTRRRRLQAAKERFA